MPSEFDARRERLSALRDQGIEPYPCEVERSHTLAQVLAEFDGLNTAQTPVTVVGRVRALRVMGGLTFVRVQDGTGVLQVVLKEDVLGEELYATFGSLVDVGDFLGFPGTPFITKKGERSIQASSWTMLAKALAPLPDKWHGLQDVETRYRQRELDLIVNDDVRIRFVVRSKLVSAMRAFLDSHDFLEVETPILQSIPGGASARPFVTHHNALDADLYLRVAPELYLKRLLVGGFEKVYEIGRCFRNEGIDYAHNPEFTMLEMYWAYAKKEEYVQFLEQLLVSAITTTFGTTTVHYGEGEITFAAPWPHITFAAAINNACGIDIQKLTTPEEVVTAAKKANLGIDFSNCHGMGEHLDELWKRTARPMIIQPTWVFDYPLELKPLTKVHPADPTKSSSVQLVVQGAEIINAYYHELNDPVDQRRRFEEQQALRDAGSDEAQWMDEAFVTALEHGMPPASGVGIGIDRLVAFLTNSPNLKEVILFPTLRSEVNAVKQEKREDDVFGAIKHKLEHAKIAYTTKHHGAQPEDSDRAMGFDPAMRPHHQGAKAILVKGKKSGTFFHFVLPDDCRLDQKKVTAIIGERWSFAGADEVISATGCVPGSVPPFGSVLGLHTRVDQRLKENEDIFFNAGSLTDSIRMKLADYLMVESPEEVDCSEDV